MPSIDMDVIRNEFPNLLAQFDAIEERAIRKQVFVTTADVKDNIVRYDYVDTGNALGSVDGRMIDDHTGEVSVSAESDEGFPYPVVGNYGSVDQSPRPFFSDAEAKAETEFPDRMRREFEAAFP